MRLPSCSWPWLALAGLGACVLAVRGCVSVARAGDVETVAAGLSSVEAAGGALVGVASLLLAAWKVGWIGPGVAAPVAPTPSNHGMTREEAERLVAAALHPVQTELHAQHSRVRGDMRTAEQQQIATTERLHRLEVALADRLARIEALLTAGIAGKQERG